MSLYLAEATVKEQREAMDHMLATEEESKRKDMENRGIAEYVVHINSLPFLDIIRLLQRNNMESDAKLRKLEQRSKSAFVGYMGGRYMKS